MISSKHSPDRMARNQKIHRQLALSARTPPRTGPRLGAVLGLHSNVLVRLRDCISLNNGIPT